VPPRQAFNGPVTVVPSITVSSMLLSTRTFPLPSADDESKAVMGAAGQLKFNVVLLKVTALTPYPVPSEESRTSTGANR